LDIAATLRPSAYFSHSTAAYLNGLTAHLPTARFLDLEQSRKPKPSASQALRQSISLRASELGTPINTTRARQDFASTNFLSD
jgi:hypothetical protein